MLEFRILGPLEVVREGEPVPVTAPKQRATLAMLLLNANRVVSVDLLADSLYAGKPPVTAVTQVQRQISDLRKTLGPTAAIETRPPGYVLLVGPGQLDLHGFERQAAEAGERRARGDVAGAVRLLRDALGMWRGSALADVAYESFARAPIERLEEMRLEAVEQRIDAELALGRSASLVPELEELVSDHPLHERFAAQLMLALYRAGRQADALTAYRRLRETLVGELGLETTPALRALERSILRQDAALDSARPAESSPRSVLAVQRADGALDVLLELAAPLACLPEREVILARLVAEEDKVAASAELLKELKPARAAAIRTATFVSEDVAADVLRLVAAYNIELVLLDVPEGLGDARLPEDIGSLLDRSLADVALVARRSRVGADVFVPFGGSEHDWAAAEVGAWLAQGLGARVVLVGTRADPTRGRRDASRLLADAAIAVQRIAGVETTPLLTEPTEAGLVSGTSEAGVIVIGMPERWRRGGIGDTRRALLAAASQTVVVVHRGLRPGGLAPRDTRTRFTWTAAPQHYWQAVSTAPM